MANKNIIPARRSKLQTYEKVSAEYNISKSILTKMASKRKIKGRLIGGIVHFTEKQVCEMVHGVRTRDFTKHSRKIDIAELYLKGHSGNKIARVFAMSVRLAYSCIEELNQTGCVVVESKLNYTKV